MELNEKDKELIAKIDERLKHYKLITDNEQQAPVEEVVLDWYCHNKEENINIKCEVQCFNCMEELYFEPNIKDWVKGEGFIGTLKELSPRGAAYTIDDQDGSDWVISKENAIKPTKEEIEQHLVKIAENKGFRIGTQYRWPNKPSISEEIRTVDGKLEYNAEVNAFGHNNYTIWDSKSGWAEPITEQKELYYITIVGNSIHITTRFGLDLERAAQAIRETLENL